MPSSGSPERFWSTWKRQRSGDVVLPSPHSVPTILSFHQTSSWLWTSRSDFLLQSKTDLLSHRYSLLLHPLAYELVKNLWRLWHVFNKSAVTGCEMLWKIHSMLTVQHNITWAISAYNVTFSKQVTLNEV